MTATKMPEATRTGEVACETDHFKCYRTGNTQVTYPSNVGKYSTGMQNKVFGPG
jgi:hypothetical protein